MTASKGALTKVGTLSGILFIAVWILLSPLGNALAAQAIISDILFFARGNGGIEIMSDGSGFLEPGLERVKTGILVQGDNLPEPTIEQSKGLILLRFAGCRVRGENLIIPVYKAPVLTIQARQAAEAAVVAVELSHENRWTPYPAEKGRAIEFTNISGPIAGREKGDLKSLRSAPLASNIKAPVDAASSVSATASAFLATQLNSAPARVESSADPITGSRPLQLSSGRISEDIAPLLKDLDIVDRADEKGYMEARLKMSKKSAFRLMHPDGKAIIVLPWARSAMEKQEIRVDRGGIKSINVHQGDRSLRVIFMLAEGQRVWTETSGRRIRLFVAPLGTAGSSPAIEPFTDDDSDMADSSRMNAVVQRQPQSIVSAKPASAAASAQPVQAQPLQTSAVKPVTALTVSDSATPDSAISVLPIVRKTGNQALSSMNSISVTGDADSGSIRISGLNLASPRTQFSGKKALLTFPGTSDAVSSGPMALKSETVSLVRHGSSPEGSFVEIIFKGNVFLSHQIQGSDSLVTYKVTPENIVEGIREKLEAHQSGNQKAAVLDKVETKTAPVIASAEKSDEGEQESVIDREALLQRLERLIELRKSRALKDNPEAASLMPAVKISGEKPLPPATISEPSASSADSAETMIASEETLSESDVQKSEPVNMKIEALLSQNPSGVDKVEKSQSDDPTMRVRRRGMIKVRSRGRLFIGIPLAGDFKFRKVKTPNQLIIRVDGQLWEGEWDFDRPGPPLKFVRVVKKENGFVMVFGFATKYDGSVQVDRVEKGLNVIFNEGSLNLESLVEDGVVKGPGETGMILNSSSGNSASDTAIADTGGKIPSVLKPGYLAVSDSSSEPGSASVDKSVFPTSGKSHSGNSGNRVASSITSSESVSGRTAPEPAAPAPAITAVSAQPSEDAEDVGTAVGTAAAAASATEDKADTGDRPDPIRPRSGDTGRVEPLDPSIARMTDLKTFAMVNGRRVIGLFDRPVKARMIKASSQVIVAVENAAYTGSEPVKMVFEDPVKVIRCNTGSGVLRIITVLTGKAQATMKVEAGRVIIDFIKPGQDGMDRVEKLSMLGRRKSMRESGSDSQTDGDEVEMGTNTSSEGGKAASEVDKVESRRLVVDEPARDMSQDALLDSAQDRLRAEAVQGGAVVTGQELLNGSAGQVVEHVFGAGGPPFEYADSTTIGRALEDAERLKKAHDLFIEGLALAERGDWIGACESYAGSLGLVPHDVNVIRAMNIATPKKEAQEFYLEANGLGSSDEWHKAAWAYSQAMKKDPTNPKYSYAYENARKLSEVMRIFDEGVIFYNGGHFGKAIEAFRTVTRDRPDWARGHLQLGMAYDAKKWIKAAVMAYQRGIRIEPNNGEILHALDLARKKLTVQTLYENGKRFEEKGDLDRAVEEFRKALALEREYRDLAGDKFDTYLSEARKLFGEGRLSDGLDFSDKAIRARPEDVEGHYWKGKCLMGLGRVAEAVVEFKKVIELDPKNNKTIADLMGE